MSTSSPTGWTCQCGTFVPFGCSHSCGGSFEAQPPFPLTPGEIAELRELLAERRATKALIASIGSSGQFHKMTDPYEAGRKARAQNDGATVVTEADRERDTAHDVLDQLLPQQFPKEGDNVPS